MSDLTPEQFDAAKARARGIATPDQFDLAEAFADPEAGIFAGSLEAASGRLVLDGEIDIAALAAWLGDLYSAHPAIFEQALAMQAEGGAS